MLPILTKLVKSKSKKMRPVTFTDVLWSIGFFILLFVLVYFSHKLNAN